jgi:predicted house-cleaning noncanonical NTP pyrophosphatase (MazG superfamily)
MDPVNQILDRINQTTHSSVSKKTSPVKSRKVARVKSKPITLNLLNTIQPTTVKEEDFDDIWLRVEKCVTPILENQKSSIFESAFQDIQKICARSDILPLLNAKYVETIKKFTKDNVNKIVEISNENDLICIYQQIQNIIQILASLFAPFERAFLFPASTVSSSVQQTFVEEFSAREEDKPKVIMCLSNGFKHQRELLFIEKAQNAKIFEELTACAKFFGFEDAMLDPLLRDSSEFFGSLESKLKPDTEHKEILIKWLQQQIDTEQTVVKHLKQFNISQLIDNARKYLYGIKFSEDLMPIVSYLFTTRNFMSFIELTNLCQYSESLLMFLDEKIREYAEDKASEAFALDDDSCIEFLFNESKVFRDCRSQTKLQSMHNAIKGFSKIMNSADLKCEFLFAKYVDKSIRNTDFLDIDDFVDFFREIGRIDEFVEHNRQFLVNRLLELGSHTFSKEISFITKIEELVGPTDGIVKSTTMITDAEESELMNYKPDIPGRVILIKYETWPSFPEISIKIPDVIQQERTKFEDFFMKETERKRIKWVDYLEDVEFTSNFGVSGKCSLIHFCCLNEMVKGEAPNVKPEIIKALLESGLVDGDGNVTRKEGNYIVNKLPLRIPETRQEEAEHEAMRIRKQKLLATTVRVLKKLRNARRDYVFAEIKEEIPDVTDEELCNVINEAADKEYIKVDNDDISYYE